MPATQKARDMQVLYLRLPDALMEAIRQDADDQDRPVQTVMKALLDRLYSDGRLLPPARESIPTMPETQAQHQCPVEGCPRRLPRNLLMCKPHWLRVPRELRHAVNMTWAAAMESDAAWDAYIDARTAAIASVQP